MHKIIAYIPERKRFRNRWLGHLENSQPPMHLIDGVLYPVSGEHTGHYLQAESTEMFVAYAHQF